MMSDATARAARLTKSQQELIVARYAVEDSDIMSDYEKWSSMTELPPAAAFTVRTLEESSTARLILDANYCTANGREAVCARGRAEGYRAEVVVDGRCGDRYGTYITIFDDRAPSVPLRLPKRPSDLHAYLQEQGMDADELRAGATKFLDIVHEMLDRIVPPST